MDGRPMAKLAVSLRIVPPFLGIALLFICQWCADFSFSFPVELDPTGSFYVPRFCAMAAFGACALLHRRLENLGILRAVPLVLGFCAGVGRILSVVAGIMPLAVPCAYLGLVLQSGAEAFLLVMWLARCCELEPRETRIVFPLAYLLVACAYFILMAMHPWVATVGIVVAPMASGLLLAQVVRQGQNETGALVSDENERVEWTFPLLPVILLVVYKVIFYFSLSLTDGPSLYGPLGIVVISLVALFATTFFFDRYSASLLYRLALPLMVAGLLLLSWLKTGSMVATLLTNASNIGFELFILITLAEICFKYRIDGVWMFGIVELFSSAANTLGWFLGGVFVSTSPVGSPLANALVAVVVVGLVAASTLFFNDRLVSKTFGTEPVTSNGRGGGAPDAVMSYYEELVWRCERVARRYGLTHREEEVLELLAQGMGAARIESDLCISNSTAKTHIRHVYEKLGVHSRDEARRIVESV